MKTNILYIAPIILAASSLMAGCSADDEALAAGEGKVSLSATLAGDVKVVSRADADDLRDTYGPSLKLWLTKPGSGPVRQYDGLDNLPQAPVALPSGSYVAEAWAGDSVPASWGEQKYFKGYEPFEITRAATTDVAVTCKIANTLVSVVYDDGVDDLLKDYTMKVSSLSGELTFDGRDSRKAYFMLPTKSKTLSIELSGTTIDGKAYTQTSTIDDAQPTTEYVVTVRANSSTPDPIGGAMLDIEVDATEIDVNDEFTITLAPEIKGIGFDIAQPVSGEQGKIGRRSIYITAADALTHVEMESGDLTPIIGHDKIGLINPEETYLTTLASAGIEFKHVYSDDGRLTNIRVNFEESFTNSLTNGSHTFRIVATDAADGTAKTSESTLTFTITDAPLAIAEAENVQYTSATLRARVLKADVTDTGFKYRRSGTAAWTTVAATAVGEWMTADIDGLDPSATYEYLAYADGFETTAMTLTTLSYPQLPNSGFEEWNTSTKAYLLAKNEAEIFWDSGNHGSCTMQGRQVTTPDASVKHSGQYSAMLKSQFVGIGSFLGKFAAGNAFIGKFIDTEDTYYGILGFGRPFETPVRPKALRGWVKYRNGAIDYSETDLAPKGTDDTGIIYIALLDGTTSSYNNSGEWPVMVRTKTKGNDLFNPKGANVIAYGEKIFTGPTDGEAMVPFEIRLDDVNPGLEFVNILVVASASRYGDYYTGSTQSTMWIDDLELVY